MNIITNIFIIILFSLVTIISTMVIIMFGREEFGWPGKRK